MTNEKIISIEFANTNDILQDTCTIIDNAKAVAYTSVNAVLVERNWLIGKRIAEEEMKGEKRAQYGAQIMKQLSKDLMAIYNEGFTKTNLYSYWQFYKMFPQIFHAVSGKSRSLLSWTHYRALIQVSDDEAREWYHNEALQHAWSSRILQRNISSQYYFRLLSSQRQDIVRKEMQELTAPLQDKFEYIKNPVVAEFLGFSNHSDFTESNLEKSILNHLQSFLMELGKGYAFVARQQHIQTEKEDYYIDLVFYNYYMKCFVLIDLKTSKVRYQDVGQMDMYVKMYDELKRTEGDNPTIGILLCADTDEDVARYSGLHTNDQLFASKYFTYMPTKEELRREIELQKQLFLLQNNTEE